MSVLKNEISLINNSALGAYLLWNFAIMYQNEHQVHEPTPGVLVFLVLPILFHQPTLDFLDRTNSGTGLAKFSEKFLSTKFKKSNLLLDIHGRALGMREISLHSLKVAVRTNLLTIVPDTGRVVAVDADQIRKPRSVPAVVLKMKKNSEKLGLWFSENSLKEISFFLKVFF